VIRNLGDWRIRQIRQLGHLNPDLLRRIETAHDVGVRSNNPQQGPRIDLWVDDWWELAWTCAASERNTTLGNAAVADVRAFGRRLIGELSKLEAHAGYRGYAVVGERTGPILDGWIADGERKPWPGRHMLDRPAQPYFMVPRVQMWRGKPVSLWYPKLAKGELWRLQVGAEQL
jgi:hypothetical protein